MFKHWAMMLVVLIGACGGDAATTTPTTRVPQPVATTQPAGNEGGFGAPAQAEGEFAAFGDRSVGVRGELQLATNGCWSANLGESKHLVVFPIGAAIPASDPTSILTADGTALTSGSAVDGTVRWVDVDSLPGGPSGRWAEYVRFCQPSEQQVAVFDSIETAFEPGTLSEPDLAALISQATFTEAWPCGYGWAMSTDDEMVGLFIYQRADIDPATRQVVLPDVAWSAEVVVGKHLFANHCDDVFELWEPNPVVAARWPITAGTLEILDELPAGEVSAEVRATLTGAVATTDSGTEVPFGPIDLFNRSFGFLAG